MTAPLLQTKLRMPPIRADRVPRPRLIERLNSGLTDTGGFARRLTLLSAPAGFGKTTLLVDWLRGAGGQPDRGPAQRPAWLTLDEGENDPARFLAYLIAALRTVDAGIGGASLAMLQSPQPPRPDALLTALANDLAAQPSPFILVLDDYHSIRSLAVHRTLGFLLECSPPCMHLVIATREDPPLPLSRLRARGQVLEIRQADLQLTEDEAAEFLRHVMQVELAPRDVAAIHRRTEGWVAGLQLAALSLQGSTQPEQAVRSFTGSHRYVLDYLMDEVFSRQPPELQRFLLRTSILDRLCGPLCEAVAPAHSPPGPGAAQERAEEGTRAGRASGQEVLEHLERSNLFVVPLDEERRWYRYHPLFAELLRHRLELEEPDAAPLHVRAGLWYAKHGLTADAIRHALAGRDWDLAGRLIIDAGGHLLRRGEIATLLGWYAALPAEIVHSRAGLSYGNAWALLLAGQLDPAETLLARAEELAATQVEPGEATERFTGELAAAGAYLARARGDLQRSVELSHQALALLPQTDLLTRSIVAVSLGLAYWHGGRMAEAEPVLLEALRTGRGSGNEYARLAAQIFLGRVKAVRGELRDAARIFSQVIEEGSLVPIAALAHLDLAAVQYEWNALDRAGEQLQQGLRMAELSGNAEFRVAARMLLARLKAATGEASAAEGIVREAHELARSGGLPAEAVRRVAAEGVELALRAGDPAGAEGWARDTSADADGHPFYRFLGLTAIRLKLARGERRAAAEALQRCHEVAARAGWGYGLIATLVLQALAAGSAEEGAGFLGEALVRAQPERFVRVFADAGRGLAPLLESAALRGIAADYVGEILAVIGQAATPMPEPLSERELQVLRLLAAGLSNRAIAEKLILSEGTVKAHVHNIYGKLAAANRTEAVARARELHLM